MKSKLEIRNQKRTQEFNVCLAEKEKRKEFEVNAQDDMELVEHERKNQTPIHFLITVYIQEKRKSCISSRGGLQLIYRDKNKSEIYIYLLIIINAECNIRRQCNSNHEEN